MMVDHLILWSRGTHRSSIYKLISIEFTFMVLFKGFCGSTFLFYLSACGVNRGARFTAKEIPWAQEENLSKEVGPSTTETSSTPVVAAVTPELAPNPLSPPPAVEPPPSSTPDSSASKQPVQSKRISGEDAPSVPPTSIAGSFLLECLVTQGNKDILFVSVMCRVLKGGVVQPSVGTLPTDWQISSMASPITWGSISGITVPTLPGFWNADFSLPVGSYIGRSVRVKNPENSGWIETTLKAIDIFTLNGFQSLASLGTIALGGGSGFLTGCPDAIQNTVIEGVRVKTSLTVNSSSGAVVVSLRGLCGSDLGTGGGANPGRMIVTSKTSNTKIFEMTLASGSLSTGPLSLKEGTYEISFETRFNSRFPDGYDNIGFRSLQLIPIDGKLSSSKFEFLSK